MSSSTINLDDIFYLSDYKNKMNKIIPIFPLQLVIYPNSKYPLHIFEHRYKKMIANCLTHGSGFGIVAMFNTKMSDVGVYAEIDQITKKYENGEMDIIVKGINRFLINQLKMNPDGYYIAEVENYKDTNFNIDDSLTDTLLKEFNNIIKISGYKPDSNFWTSLNSSKFKSFKIAEKSGMDYEKRQEFLILRNENARINYLINHFIKTKNKFNSSKTLKNIIMNDGYLN